MLTDGAQVNVGPGATVNAFLGRPVEFIGVPSIMDLYVVADAAGVTCQLLINVGANQMAPISSGHPVNVASAAGAGPKADEDLILAGQAIPAGARLQLNITNGGTAATNVRYRAVIR